MKIVYLIRHAKSSWSNPNLTDFERPLNNRGVTDIQVITKKLKALIESIDLVFASSSARTVETSKYLLGENGLDYETLQLKDDLYHASAQKMIELLSSLNNDITSVAVIAHNPGLTDLANEIATIRLDNLPTSGTLAIQFDIEHWEDILNTKGELQFFEYPKKYRNKLKAT